MNSHATRRAQLLGNLNRPEKKRVVRRLLMLQDPTCFYCRDLIEREQDAHIDHFYPVSTHPDKARDRSNLVLACAPCDTFKKAKDPTGYKMATFKQMIAEGSTAKRRQLWRNNVMFPTTTKEEK